MLRACLQADPSIINSEREKLLTLLEKHGEEPAAPPRLLRRKEVAARLGLSLRAVDRLCEEGTLSKRVLPGRKRSTGVLESDVDALIRGEAVQ
jgi:predicted DNA-binding transcriptional regulator AlpA